jgi:hypothetical protein
MLGASGESPTVLQANKNRDKSSAVSTSKIRRVIGVSSFLFSPVWRVVFLLYMEEFSLSIWLQKSSRHIQTFRHSAQTGEVRFVQGAEVDGAGWQLVKIA